MQEKSRNLLLQGEYNKIGYLGLKFIIDVLIGGNSQWQKLNMKELNRI